MSTSPTTSQAKAAAESRWPESASLFDRATRFLPGGNTRSQLYVAPHPLYVERGEGARITLVDGQVLDDFLLNYTAAAVGYGNPHVRKAVERALATGAPFGMPTRWEIELAEALEERVPALKRVRFTNSGSEATLHAIRTARAYSGRTLVAKAEGAYHGSHDLTDFSVYTIADEPLGIVPGTRGIPAALADQIVLFPFNDLEGTIAVLEGRKDDLATVILEPFLNSAGAIRADGEYLQGIERWCRENEILLTLDEVASFRVSYSGAHSDAGITPDLICLGKSIGGGFAVGAFGGSEEVMAILDPRDSRHIKHAGTFNGHPATMAAGRAALEVLDRDAIDRMNRLGGRIVEGIRAIGADHDLPLTAAGYGSIGNIHLGRTPPRNAREALDLPKQPVVDLYWALIERGYVIAPRGQFSTCAVTTDDQVDGLLEALADCAPSALKDVNDR